MSLGKISCCLLFVLTFVMLVARITEVGANVQGRQGGDGYGGGASAFYLTLLLVFG